MALLDTLAILVSSLLMDGHWSAEAELPKFSFVNIKQDSEAVKVQKVGGLEGDPGAVQHGHRNRVCRVSPTLG